MKNVMNRAKMVCGGEEGASNIEIIVWIGVVLLIATALFAFREQVVGFLKGSGNQVDSMGTKTNMSIN